MGKTLHEKVFLENVYKDLHIEGYERVLEVKNEAVGLHAIIALHNTSLGPAIGGVRVYPYTSFEEALEDALRLSKGMTYKSAVAETGTSGGKSVIIAEGRKPLSEACLFAFAEAVNFLEGKYICAEDVGMSPESVGIISQRTPFVVGLLHHQSSGDPSRFTAWGGFRGIQAVCQKLWGSESLRGKTVAIQGLGSVGMKLANDLFWAGASLIVTDVNAQALKQAATLYNAKVVAPDAILSEECDILVPCALGGILNSETIPQLRCKAVAGVANNQLLTDEDGDALFKRGILYAPDFIINAGGLFNVVEEISEEGYNPFTARAQVDRIHELLMTTFTLSDERKVATHRIAVEVGDYNLEHQVSKRTTPAVFHHQKHT